MSKRISLKSVVPCVPGISTTPTAGARCWKPVVDRYRIVKRRYFRGKAAVTSVKVV
jgi:hypothetical protein